MLRRLIHVLNADDNVATALAELSPGMVADLQAVGRSGQVEIRSAVPFGHKIALAPIARGAPVRKYGEVIGRATQDISPGEHVHTHNVESQRGRGDLTRG